MPKTVHIEMFTANSNPTELEVSKGTNVTFLCSAHGDIKPQLSIRGHRSNMSIPTKEGDSISPNTATVKGKRTMLCNDTDVYICTASVNMKPGGSKNVSIFVTCAPELNTSFPTHNYYSTIEKKTLTLEFPVVVYPAPTAFELTQTSNTTGLEPVRDRKRREVPGRTVPADQYNAAFRYNEPPNGVIILQMHGLDAKDSGQYRLSVQNGIGGGLEINFSVTVNKKDDEDDDIDIHTIIGTVCGVIGALGVVVPATYCAVKKCRTKK